MARMQSVDHNSVLVFVGDANSHHSEWLESVFPTDRYGRDALDFRNLSGCEQLVRGPTHIAGNRLDLVITDVPDLVDGTSDHCFVSCVTRASCWAVCDKVQCQKNRTNWDSVRSRNSSFT